MRQEHFTTPDPVRLECSVTAGAVTVATTDRGEATVELDGPAEILGEMRVELVGDRLTIAEPRSSLLGLLTRPNESLHVAVTVPQASAVHLRTASSDAALDGQFGEVEMQSASGDLRATGEIAGRVSMKSASGDVRLGRVRGELEVRVVSGDVHADTVEGSASVNSVSGQVLIGSLREGTVSIRSVSGDIALGVEPGSSVDLDASSASGRLSSEVVLSDSPVGDGGPTVVIRGVTVSGDVRVHRATHASLA